MLGFSITAASKYFAFILQINHLIKTDFRRNYECVTFPPQCWQRKSLFLLFQNKFLINNLEKTQ